MLYHVMIGSNDIEKTKRFYDAVLAVVGAKRAMVNVNAAGKKRLFYIHNDSVFAITEPINGEPATAANGSTFGFACDSPEQVKKFHAVALANGATDVEDPPGPRSSDMGEMHLCYFLDPDGHKICGIFKPA